MAGNYTATNWSSPGVDPARAKAGSQFFSEFPRWIMYRRMQGALGGGAGGRGRGGSLPYGGGPYYGSQGQQFGQGLADVSSALRSAMQDYHQNKIGWNLLNQADPSGALAKQYQDMGLTGQEAWQEQNANWDAQNEMKKQDALDKDRIQQGLLRQAQMGLVQQQTKNLAEGLPMRGGSVGGKEVVYDDAGNPHLVTGNLAAKMALSKTQGTTDPELAALGLSGDVAQKGFGGSAVYRAMDAQGNPTGKPISEEEAQADPDNTTVTVPGQVPTRKGGKPPPISYRTWDYLRSQSTALNPDSLQTPDIPIQNQGVNADATGVGGNQIDAATAQQFFDQAGRDPAKARALAIAAGFTGF